MKRSFFERLAQRWMETSLSKRLVSAKVKRTLCLLYPARNPEEICRIYYLEKTAMMLKMGILAGSLMILVIAFQYASVEKDETIIMRGEESRQIELMVQTGEEDEMNVWYEVSPKTYTPEEIQGFVKRFREEGAALILGENETLSQVYSNLCLQESYEEYPMQFSWESSDYERIAEDGSVENEELKSPQTVQLIAEMKYEEQVYKQEFTVCVFPEHLTETKRREKEILSALRKEDEKQKYSGQFHLPEEIMGKSAQYELLKDNTTLIAIALFPIALLAIYGAKDRDLEKELENRKKRLGLQYPEFVSKVQLLLGAGISVRNVFFRLSEDASIGEELRGELEMVVRDLKNGISLRDALERFGRRCANPLYIKFSALMLQNIKKGTEDLQLQLSGEVSEAFSLRKIQAKQLGEEAGTKLLIPMILMLAVVMAALMIPAFLSFRL